MISQLYNRLLSQLYNIRIYQFCNQIMQSLAPRTNLGGSVASAPVFTLVKNKKR